VKSNKQITTKELSCKFLVTNRVEKYIIILGFPASVEAVGLRQTNTPRRALKETASLAIQIKTINNKAS
jgi:hypothetical protein